MMDGIEVKDVTFYYSESKQHAILESFNVVITKGSIVAITGVSGCGKSTLFALLAGIYPEYAGILESGTIRYDGKSVQEMSIRERAEAVSLMFQNPDLQFCLDTVENELIFCLENIQVPKSEMDQRVKEALAFCSIQHLQKRSIQTLSGGEKQKVSLACMMALDSDYLLLDEPFANIDSETTEFLLQKLDVLNKEKGKTIILIDHQIKGLGERVDKWLVLGKDGEIAGYLDHEPANPLQKSWFDQQGITVEGYPYKTDREKKDLQTLEALIELKRVSIAYGKELPVLKDLSLSIPRQAITVLTGKSGSGKSTLFSVLGKMLGYEGQLTYQGKEVRAWKAGNYAKHVGIVFQNPSDQFVANTVYDEMAISLKKQVSADSLSAEVKRHLSSVQLWPYRRFSPYMLSQGQQRRLAVAVLLAYRCEVLICDEPTYGQDKRNIEALMKLLCRQVEEEGLTVVLSTHDQLLAETYADLQIECAEGGIQFKPLKEGRKGFSLSS